MLFRSETPDWYPGDEYVDIVARDGYAKNNTTHISQAADFHRLRQAHPNNMTAFYLTGFGIGKISSEVSVWSVVMVSALCLIYVGIMLFADKKLGWFSHVKHPEKMPAA